MKTVYQTEWPQFFTATILDWKPLLQQDNYKGIIIDALRFAIKERRINLYAFVIMNNYLHNLGLLNQLKVDSKDREYQVWKRNPLSIELFTPAVFYQKIDYIHNNPVRAGLCKFPEDYKYSSASYYETGVDDFGLFMPVANH